MPFLLSILIFSLLFILGSSAHALVVLQYHHISDQTPDITSVTPQRFEEHLQLIEQQGLQVVDLTEALTRLREGNALENSVAITFDDGYENIYTEAFPKLKHRNWPFTLFLCSEPIDRQFGGMLSWDQIREMAQSGATIANHSIDHAYLARLDPKDENYTSTLLANIKQAQVRIESEVGSFLPKSPLRKKLFAYPYGEYNLPLMELLEKEGWIAFGQQSGPIGLTSNWQALPRFPASGVYSRPSTLKTKLLSLPFTVHSEMPEDPEPNNNMRLLYRLEVARDNLSPETLRCFFQGKPVELKKDITPEQLKVEVRLPDSLPKGRSRINCTAKHQSENRYFWHSKYWLNLEGSKVASD